MPKLRSLSGSHVIAIFQRFGFRSRPGKGSHTKLIRIVKGEEQVLVVAVHGNHPIAPGTLHSIYKQASRFIPEDELRQHFYTDRSYAVEFETGPEISCPLNLIDGRTA